MALRGNIVERAFGQDVTLPGKYMRLSRVTLVNEWRRVSRPRPDGADGNPNSPEEVLVQVREITGTLDVYNAVADVAAGIAPVTSRTFTVEHNPRGPNVDAQLYQFIRSQLAGAVEA